MIKNKKINLKSSYLRSITILASGSVAAQLITVISSPFITRLFTPENIGFYTYILSISHLFMAVINGRYDMSIVTEEKEERVHALIKLSIIICLIASLLISFGYSFYFRFLSKEYSSYTYISTIIFLLLISYGIINVLNAFNNRNKEYKLMSSLYIIRAACQNFGAVVLGFFNTGMLGLLIPYLIGQIIGVKKQASSIKPHYEELKGVNREQMVEVAKLHYKQPLYSAPALFVNNFSYSSITFFIEAIFGMSFVGLYSISVRVLGLPLSIISGNVSRVFFEDASREYNNTGQFFNSFKKTTLFLTALAIPMTLAMIFIVPTITVLVFGEAWKEAGDYIKILSIMFGIRFVVSSLTPGILISKKQRSELIIQLSFIVASVVCFVFARKMLLNILVYLKFVSISFSIIYIIYYIILYKCSKNKDEKNE